MGLRRDSDEFCRSDILQKPSSRAMEGCHCGSDVGLKQQLRLQFVLQHVPCQLSFSTVHTMITQNGALIWNPYVFSIHTIKKTGAL